MKKTSILLGLMFTLYFSVSTLAQIRYLENVGTEVSVSTDIVYGSNVGILTQSPVLEEIKMDMYQLEGDTTKDKPVVLMLHTGSFLPKIINGQATGDKTDNAIVDMCERFAKKGYLAIALNYRLGWNPISSSEDVRRSTLIQAAYRSLQDVKTAVRFLRKSVEEDDNPYGIGNKFAVGGYGTGGYISMSLATLNDYDTELLIPKFLDTSEETMAIYGQAMPYIIQSVLGNFEATNYGYKSVMGPDSTNIEVPYCVPNHVGYSSDVNMVFNAGGALPDISWLNQGEIPIASMQCVLDPDAPYAEGSVIVPTTGEFVITAHGSQMVQEKADSLGNNEVFDGLPILLNDSWYQNGNGVENAATAGHDDLDGLFGIITPIPSSEPTTCGIQFEQGAPWDWWDNEWYTLLADGYHGTPPGTMACLALLGNPDMSEEKGMAMTNMMSDFFTPRIYASLIGTPVPIIYGCTDENTCNFNAEANFNDGSCIGFDVELSELTIDDPLITTTSTIMPTYEWSFNGTLIEGNGPELIPTENGTYMVTVTNTEGCSINASQFVQNVSLQEQIEEQISIYPNPATNVLIIKSENNILSTIKLFSIEGKLLRNYNVNKPQLTIEKNELSKGLYLIELEINKQSIKKTIIFN